MKFSRQLNGHVPAAGLIGDCYRTCIACVLNLDPKDVPNFMAIDFQADGTFGGRAEFEMRMWLAGRGLRMFYVPFCPKDDEPLSGILDWFGKVNGEDFAFLLAGRSVAGNHVCIYNSEGLVWDPAQCGGLVGPSSDGNYWMHVLASLRMVYTPGVET